MTLHDLLSLVGGLALFLFGMKMMSDGLEQSAGDKMQTILNKLTTNRFMGVAVGAIITSVIQSSSATTVMVVGFVNSGLMSLRQSIWVIMGANIGTTITGQLIALDVGIIAPIFTLLGVSFIIFFKNKKLNNIGYILTGLGMLFMGMNYMSDSMSTLRNSPVFTDFVSGLSHPALGILAGLVFTAIIQSSSASVGILQALALSGTIPFSSAVYILFGQNIGTCITAVLASIGTSKNAKRATLIHLLFNITGTVIFVILTILLPVTDFIELISPSNPAAQIANMHTIFNVVTTLVLLPCGSILEKISKIIIRGKDEKEQTCMKLNYIQVDKIINPISITIYQIQKELSFMYELCIDNVEKSFKTLLENNQDAFEQIDKNEEYIDFLNVEISKFLSKILSQNMSEKNSELLTSYLKIVGNIERISDHAVNVSEYSQMIIDRKYTISSDAYKEIEEMMNSSLSTMKLIDYNKWKICSLDFDLVNSAEKKIDALTEIFINNQIERIKSGTCKGDISVIYSEMITDYERIGDHMLNIAELMPRI